MQFLKNQEFYADQNMNIYLCDEIFPHKLKLGDRLKMVVYFNFFGRQGKRISIFRFLLKKTNRRFLFPFSVFSKQTQWRSQSQSRKEPKLLAGARSKFQVRLPALAPGQTKSVY
jgi:hypothetical protein